MEEGEEVLGGERRAIYAEVWTSESFAILGNRAA